ncbi:MAG: 2,3-bisphosphoglycerate-independent phosphoglycerate mutase [gamma proteobacterium symbiont of Bathyaustriella thionipta]|nr:2,3-bisphosphoglycerate-independent phosphoglycerate mutase [gamma proteobacterium symbiont of Bathyaustriella thionipta]MCU7948825.1 2,3-bisphosphoglycerate-independent phosphoglycerate mutase [gamma proteobacterium symbiont of Bathyaustriella thionipta]MCU7954364.1 2,3-bisphosphoglycerate-independent phosphoglycerate mutase [gamma proteobacterium symbiont of Bathyaustriella thionipta]MCU7955283.1 2,3-bisphosphoglycerate-independent phosphoglycerate mutase [gamma proteobacterium symbiont of 
MSKIPKLLALIILDGWGCSEESSHNAISEAKTPVFDKLWKKNPHTLIKASGAEVGLPAGQMGNSEVGHLNIGSGRVVYQEYTRVSRAVRTGSFFTNCTLTEAVDKALQTDKAIHIMGLLSSGGVHSHEDHIHAMTTLAAERGVKKVYLHAFLDGRDTPPKSAKASLKAMQAAFDEQGSGRIASIVGRYYAMDRDHRWERVKYAYDAIANGQAEFTSENAVDALVQAYKRGETDEFVKSTCIVPKGEKPVQIEDGDVLFFMNYRSDRARQITRPFIEDDFEAFKQERHFKLAEFVSLTEYSSKFDIPVAFPPERLTNVFGEYISKLGLRQLRIAETEKYAHVTFFFNGGIEEPFQDEDRILVNSPDVATYDLQPEMNAPKLSKKLITAIKSDQYDTIICNFANPDMVGHTGNENAAIKAIEALDEIIGQVTKAIHKAGGEMLITADHGNAELMLDEKTGQAHTAHTCNPVPFIYVGRDAVMAEKGALSDIAPTMLYLMDIEVPPEMNGRSLVTLAEDIEEQEA